MSSLPLYPRFTNPLLGEGKRTLPKEVAVIGAGNIGPDIGYYLKTALPESKLILVDVIESQLKNAEKRFQGYTQKSVDRKKMKPEAAQAILDNIIYTSDYSSLKNVDLVIEAATEDLNIKKKIVAMIEASVRDDTIITSNTSSIPAERIFPEAKIPSRTTITHFFGPAWRNPAVEVITWSGVDQNVVDYLRWMFCMTGKVPFVSADKLCFILNRIFENWCNGAVLLLQDMEVTSRQVDLLSQEFVAAGPFFVLNMTGGNPIVHKTNTQKAEEEGAHYAPSHLLKSIATWFTLKPGEKEEVDPKIAEQVRNRLLGVLFSQSFDIINKGIGTLEDLNLGCMIGLGFRKGPFEIMNDQGEDKVKTIMAEYQKSRPGMPGMEGDYSRYQDFKKNILVDDIDGVKIITMRRPQFMNALNDDVNMEILDVMKAYENDPAVKGYVITGYGDKAFCAGAEIGKFPQLLGDAAGSVQYSKDCSLLLRYLDSCTKPVVAAVNGMALGGGFELAIRCHKLVATESAWFQLPEVTLGIVPGIGGLVVPYRRWPNASKLFHDMIRQAARLTAKEAADLGIISAVAEDYFSLIQKAVQEVKALVGQALPRISDSPVEIAPLEPLAAPMSGKLALSKEVVEIINKAVKDAAAADSFEKALEIGYLASGEVACTDSAKEGISAFMQKRPPEFKK
jgi:enoyl-CoA hydratase/3-hydroxyacyl-CoA dehydrogenase